jgi:ABC-type sugar transport system substrate-binding protein
MADAILFIGMNRPHVGMDDKAMGYLAGDGLKYLKGLEGNFFERLEMIGLTAHGGNVNFMIILHGTRAKLDELRRTDEFEAFAFKLGSQFDGLRIVPGLSWEGIQKVMARMSAAAR